MTWESEMPFGKHKGKQLKDIPVKYLYYVMHNFPELPLELFLFFAVKGYEITEQARFDNDGPDIGDSPDW